MVDRLERNFQLSAISQRLFVADRGPEFSTPWVTETEY